MGHLALDEKSKIKAYMKDLPIEMKSLVRNAKATTLQEAIEESQLIEDDLAQAREERVSVGVKRKCEGPQGSFQESNSFAGGKRNDSQREARWCPKCKSKHFGSSNPTLWYVSSVERLATQAMYAPSRRQCATNARRWVTRNMILRG